MKNTQSKFGTLSAVFLSSILLNSFILTKVEAAAAKDVYVASEQNKAKVKPKLTAAEAKKIQTKKAELRSIKAKAAARAADESKFATPVVNKESNFKKTLSNWMSNISKDSNEVSEKQGTSKATKASLHKSAGATTSLRGHCSHHGGIDVKASQRVHYVVCNSGKKEKHVRFVPRIE